MCSSDLEDLYYYIKATSAITKGDVVMFTGSVGASGVLTGAPATGITDGSYIMGIAAETLAHNDFGLVQYNGVLRGLDTSAYTDGAILWYNPVVTGGLTSTKPTAPNVKVQMAAVVNAGNGNSGSIQIRVNPGSVLGGTDSNVQFGTLNNLDVIQYNSTAGYWQNVAANTLSVSYAATAGSAGSSTTATNLAGGTAGALAYQTGAGATTFLALGSTNYVLTAGASAPQYVAQSTLSVGSATSAGKATNLAGGAAASIPYQSAADTTAFLASSAGDSGKVLTKIGRAHV